MANVLIPKKSVVPGKVPTTGDLNLGEFCVNSPDRIIYYRQPDTGNIVDLSGSGGSSAYLVQSAFAAPYHYIGRAPEGTATNASGWDIARIEISSDGSTTTLNATGAWSNRASLSYT